MSPYYFIRFSGPLLLILVGLKILSGFALVGRGGMSFWLSELHQNQTLDLILLFLFIFHALYGLRLFLIDLGIKRERLLFWASTVLSILGFLFSYFYFF